MKKGVLTVSTGFILLFALIFFFDDQGFLAALIPPVLVHEFGHFLCLRAFGARLKRIRLDLSGLSLSYAGAHMNLIQELCTALMGPLIGLAYAFVASWLASQWGNPILSLSAGISILLSAFNLLPTMPLDGGRATFLLLNRLIGRRRAAKSLYVIGLAVSVSLMAAGIWCIDEGLGCSLLIAGIWILSAASEDACKIRSFVIQ